MTVLPVLDALGLETGTPASQLAAAASAAYVLGMASERHRHWVIELPSTPEALIAGVKVRLTNGRRSD
jgi:hypothetical protein